jgi:hypothetical protein
LPAALDRHALYFSFMNFFLLLLSRQEGGADVDGGHLRAVRRRAPVEEVRREEALQLQLPKVCFLATSAVPARRRSIHLHFPKITCFFLVSVSMHVLSVW